MSLENVIKQAANLRDFELPMLAPGILINTWSTIFEPIRQAQMRRAAVLAIRRQHGRLSRVAYVLGPPHSAD